MPLTGRFASSCQTHVVLRGRLAGTLHGALKHRLLPGTCKRSYYSEHQTAPSAEGTNANTDAWNRRIVWLKRSLAVDPSNSVKFAELLRALNNVDSHQVIRYFENQRPEAAFENRDAVREYLRALVHTNRLEFVDLDLILCKTLLRGDRDKPLHQLHETVGKTSKKGMSSAHLNFQSPMQVEIVDAHRKSVWRLLTGSLWILIAVAGITIFADSVTGSLQKGMGSNSKSVKPVEDIDTTFDDVKGCDEVKRELQEIILYLKDPDRFTRLGAKLPKGVMMSGPPGTGKTLLARAVAGEAGTPFLQASGSEFEEMFVGVGARRIRDLFAEARKHAPCILFIDELDAVGSTRSNHESSSVRMTLNQLLVELDGFEQNNGVVVICATNLLGSLDPALTRPGRLDKLVVVSPPDIDGRRQILDLYASKLKLDEDVDLDVLARRTTGMTGADLSNLLNIAAVRSSAQGLAAVPMRCLEDAFDRVVVGLERWNPMSDEEKRLTAYHEGGHTLLSRNRPGNMMLHKATIMPRGQALGITWHVPKGESYSHALGEMEARLEILMGGRAAEEVTFGAENVTGGCSSDLKQATQLAQQMVMNYGMSGSESAPWFLDFQDYARLSDETKRDLDQKTQYLLTRAYDRALDYLREHFQELEYLADALVEFETLDAEEIALATLGNKSAIAERRNTQANSKKENEKDASIFASIKGWFKQNSSSKGTAANEKAETALADVMVIENAENKDEELVSVDVADTSTFD